MTAVEDTNPLHGKKVVSSIGMIINTTEKCCGCILADHLGNKVSASRMLIHEVGNIVNEPSNQNERSFGRLLLVAIPRNNGELIAVRGPKETFLGLSEAFQLHRELTFANFVIRENLQLLGQADLLHSPDEPFGRIILVPFDGIPVVHRKLVVEIVIALSNGDKSSDHMIAGCVLVIERSFTEPMSERIDAEGRVMNKNKSRCGGKEVTALPVAPK